MCDDSTQPKSCTLSMQTKWDCAHVMCSLCRSKFSWHSHSLHGSTRCEWTTTRVSGSSISGPCPVSSSRPVVCAKRSPSLMAVTSKLAQLDVGVSVVSGSPMSLVAMSGSQFTHNLSLCTPAVQSWPASLPLPSQPRPLFLAARH